MRFSKTEKMTFPAKVAIHLVVFFHICFVTNAKVNPCPYSTPTVTKVTKCPMDETEWKTAREKKQCHWITQNCTDAVKFQYHCLPTESPEIFVEVCTPIINIVGQHCPVYDMKRNHIRPNYHASCKFHPHQCPPVYSSDRVHEYQDCFKKSVSSKKSDERRDRLLIEINGAGVITGVVMICVILTILVILKLTQMFCLKRFKQLLKRNRCCSDCHDGEDIVQSTPLNLD